MELLATEGTNMVTIEVKNKLISGSWSKDPAQLIGLALVYCSENDHSNSSYPAYVQDEMGSQSTTLVITEWALAVDSHLCRPYACLVEKCMYDRF